MDGAVASELVQTARRDQRIAVGPGGASGSQDVPSPVLTIDGEPRVPVTPSRSAQTRASTKAGVSTAFTSDVLVATSEATLTTGATEAISSLLAARSWSALGVVSDIHGPISRSASW